MDLFWPPSESALYWCKMEHSNLHGHKHIIKEAELRGSWTKVPRITMGLVEICTAPRRTARAGVRVGSDPDFPIKIHYP